MTKASFFSDLEERLKGLPEEERKNILRVYEDLFAKAAANGKNEQEIVQSLGFTQSYEVETPAPAGKADIDDRRKPGSATENTLKALMASLALGLFNLIFVLWFFIALGAIVFSFIVTGFALVTGPVWILIGSAWPASTAELLLLVFTAMATLGLGILISLFSLHAAKWFGFIVKKYVRLNVRLIKGE
jgi:uncharacterized membrane protein